MVYYENTADTTSPTIKWGFRREEGHLNQNATHAHDDEYQRKTCSTLTHAVTENVSFSLCASRGQTTAPYFVVGKTGTQKTFAPSQQCTTQNNASSQKHLAQTRASRKRQLSTRNTGEGDNTYDLRCSYVPPRRYQVAPPP